MPHDLITIITSDDPAVRNRSLDGFCRAADAAALLEAADELDGFRRTSENLYERVRAIFFLAAIYRYHLPPKLPAGARGLRALRGLRAPARPAVRGGGRRVPRRRSGAQGPSDTDRQRPGGRLPRPGLPDPGRPGAAERPLGPRQPVDVPHGPSGRPSAGDPPAAAAERAAPTTRSPSSSSARPSAWTSRTAAGATFSSSAWTFPRAPGC